MKKKFISPLLRFYVMIAVCVIASLSSLAQQYQPDWKSLDSREMPEWYQRDKFGIFIHWGVYAVPAWAPPVLKPGEKKDRSFSEWYWKHLHDSVDYFVKHHEEFYGDKIKYQDFAGNFKAENFDPGFWAELFRRSGARYVVLTSKHHDGFALWPSRFSRNWNSVDIGPHRNICKELSAAVTAAGLKMGFYYSLYEWFHPLMWKDSTRYVNDYMLPQLKELVEDLRPSLLFADGEWDFSSKLWKSESFLAWLYNNSAVRDSIVVNDRWGSDCRARHGGYYSTEFSSNLSDYKAHSRLSLWEECRGIGKSFGYNAIENLEDYQTSDSLITNLIEIVSHGGNFLLNVGPTADGRIPVIMQQRLQDIGDWLKVNGEAIFGTVIWDKDKQQLNRKHNPYTYYTRKGKDLYALCTNWPEGKIIIHGIRKFKKVRLLGAGQLEVKATLKNDQLTIVPPVISPNTEPCKWAWVFKIEDVI
ncbi:alpha-L-fucosidase [Chitinophaga dinghuensis]|nr:alpha-L-fucosidase [Chitinophaga dinghuensis]